MSGQTLQFDETKLNAFVGKMLDDMGAAYGTALIRIGDQLGLYKALHEGGAMTAKALSERTQTAERYVREWLANQAASGYVAYHPESETFELPPEQAMVFAVEDSPVYMIGGFDGAAACIEDTPKVAAAFRSGGGVGWGDHTTCLFCAVEKFFRPGYQQHVVEEWLPALEGVANKLERGARVADVGCGHGVSTVIMAQAFPNSEFVGYDFHEASISHARDLAESNGVAANTRFEVALAKDYPAEAYDLVCMFDCLHDMGDPRGAARHVRSTMKADGTWMLVEPMAGDRLEDNLNPVGRLYYAASTMVCVPTSLAQETGAALGAQAGEAKLREIITGAGFSSVRRAAETPFNMVLEARP